MQVRTLHIGAHLLRDARWGGMPDVGSCARDAWLLAALAMERRCAGVDVLTGVAATAASARTAILRAKDELTAEDQFILTFSGHGLAVYVNDVLIVTWCLFDDDLRRDELAALLGQFAPGVRILVVANCCYSSAGLQDNGGPFHPLTLPPENATFAARKYAQLAPDGEGVIRLYDGAVAPWNAAMALFEDKRANIIEIDSCGPTDKALSANELNIASPFIKEFLDETAAGGFAGFSGFMEHLELRCAASPLPLPLPRYRAFDPRAPAFEALGPFRT